MRTLIRTYLLYVSAAETCGATEFFQSTDTVDMALNKHY